MTDNDVYTVGEFEFRSVKCDDCYHESPDLNLEGRACPECLTGVLAPWDNERERQQFIERGDA